MAVGFADMVGFTMLSQHLGDEELAAVVARFEELAHDTVVALGGRVVKMIGDEVMFVVPTADRRRRDRAEPGRGLRRDDLLSDVRVALAVGPGAGEGRRLLRTGGQSGQPAGRGGQPGHRARLRRVPGRRWARTARSISTCGPSGPGTLKDIGRVQVWKLSRAGQPSPGAERGRNVRWERLGEVLRELDDLRERGEHLVVRASRRDLSEADAVAECVRVRTGLSPVETERGDPVGPRGRSSPRRRRAVGPAGRRASRSVPALRRWWRCRAG